MLQWYDPFDVFVQDVEQEMVVCAHEVSRLRRSLDHRASRSLMVRINKTWMIEDIVRISKQRKKSVLFSFILILYTGLFISLVH